MYMHTYTHVVCSTLDEGLAKTAFTVGSRVEECLQGLRVGSHFPQQARY